MRRRGRKGLTEIKLTPEGWVYLIVLGFITVGAVLRNVNLLIVMAGMMYAPLLLNWRLAIQRLKSLNASRRLPNRINVNELANVQWTCENRLPGIAAWNVVVNDRIERVSEADQTVDPSENENQKAWKPERWFSRWFGEIFTRMRRKVTHEKRSEVKLGFVRINAGQSEVQTYRVFFSRRGKYSVGPAELSTTFPFGLIVSRIHFPKTETLFVGPEIGQLRPTWEQRVQSVASGSESIKRRRSLEEFEFYALRPWRSGDCKKNIHWRTSAKFGQPIVKQHDQPNNRDFALMLDLFDDGSDPDYEMRCEQGLSFTATAVLQIGKAVQGQIAVAICGRETEFCLNRYQQKIVLEVIKRLSVAEGSDQPQAIEMLIQLSDSVSRSTPIYVISSRPRPESLDPIRLQTNSGDPHADRIARRLKRILPMVRWLEIDSDEFRSMFTIDQNLVVEKKLKEMSSKWSSNVRR